jgi:LuxR family maltose regulon positive regulatory protein
VTQVTEKPSESLTPNGDPIMFAKFQVPATPPWMVVRIRLYDDISRGARGPLTLVDAPVGSGKSVLASSWVRAGLAPGPVVWISLDDEDNHPGVFWSYVLAGLGQTGVTLPKALAPNSVDAVDRPLLSRLAATLSERQDPVVLVLDNAQVLTGPAVISGIDFLICHAGPQFRMIVLARPGPSLPLHRYRLSGAVTEIGLTELSFTPAEALALLATHGTEATGSMVTRLIDRTKGWPAGLRLAALSLQHRANAGEASGYGPGECSEITEYIRAETLDAQPAEIRDFLLRTSVAPRLWTGLAVRLSGRRDAGRVLADLERTNAFIVSHADEGGYFQYLPIIRDMLLEQLDFERPGKERQLHRKAALWHADAGNLVDAIHHAVAATDWQYAAALMTDGAAAGHALVGPGDSGLLEAFAAMPPDVVGPEAAVVRAALSLHRLDTDACTKHLLHAQELIGGSPSEETATLHLALAVTELACAGLQGDSEVALAAAGEGEALLSRLAHDAGGEQAGPRALILYHKGRALMQTGELTLAAASLTEGLRIADGPAGDHLELACSGLLALLHTLRSHHHRATELAHRAVAVADRNELCAADRPPAADISLAWIHTDEYNLTAAQTHADRAAPVTDLLADPLCTGLLGLVRARLRRARGDRAGAAAELERVRGIVPLHMPMPSWLLDQLAIAEARLTVADGDTAETANHRYETVPYPHRGIVLASRQLALGDVISAARTVSDLLARADLPLDLQVEGWLVSAGCELADNRTTAARVAVDHALTLAAAERLRRPFFEASPHVRRFLRQDHDLIERHAWLSANPATDAPTVPSRPARSDGGPPTSPAPVIDALTGREREVLAHLAALLTTEEIARTMFVSVNTVKTHVRGILRKLDAKRRNDAVRRARDLGML